MKGELCVYFSLPFKNFVMLFFLFSFERRGLSETTKNFASQKLFCSIKREWLCRGDSTRFFKMPRALCAQCTLLCYRIITMNLSAGRPIRWQRANFRVLKALKFLFLRQIRLGSQFRGLKFSFVLCPQVFSRKIRAKIQDFVNFKKGSKIQVDFSNSQYFMF